MATKNYLDKTGLLYFWGKVKDWVSGKIPTKTSQLTNDSGYITSADVPEGAVASTTTPKMDGTAAVGTETAFARGDHIHPKDTTKVDKVTGKGLSTNDYTTAEKNKLAGIADNANNYTLPAATESSLGGVTLTSDINTDSTNTTKATTPKGVVDYVSTVVGTPFKFGGSVTLSDLPSMPTDTYVNTIYNIKVEFTTTASFVEGAGKKYPAGSNIIVVNIDDTVKYDVLTGFFDLSPYALDADFVPIPNEEIAAIVS